MIVHTNNVNAQSYVADDNYIISSNYHDFFRHYFGEDKSYQYFSYRCSNDSYNRNCYYGIDSDNNYIKIEYEDTGNYSYNQKITTGVDENFSVSGNAIFKQEISQAKFTNIILILVICFAIFILMLGGL